MKTDTKQNVPVLRFPEFAGEWEKRRFGEIYSFRSTNSFSRENLSYEYGKVKNIHYGDIHTKFSTAFRIEQEEVPYIAPDVNMSKIPSSNYCQEGDLVIADASEDYDGVGTTIEIVELGKQPVLAGLHTILARPDLMPMALGFGGYAMQTPHIRQQIRFIAQGIKVLSLSARQLSATHIFIPSLPEQNKIAKFLSAVDERIGLLKKKKEQLEAYKRGTMQQIFSRQVRFKDSEGKDYTDWQHARFGDITTKFTDKNKNLVAAPIYSVTNSKGFVLQEEHFDGKIAGNDSINHKIVKKGDFAYNPARINVGSIGHFTGEIAIISSLYVCFRTKKSVGDDFFRYLLQLERTKYQINTFGEGGVRIYLWYELFALIKCELPCLEEQQKIANFLGAIDKKLELCEKQIADTEKFKKGLLQQMFV